MRSTWLATAIFATSVFGHDDQNSPLARTKGAHPASRFLQRRDEHAVTVVIVTDITVTRSTLATPASTASHVGTRMLDLQCLLDLAVEDARTYTCQGFTTTIPVITTPFVHGTTGFTTLVNPLHTNNTVIVPVGTASAHFNNTSIATPSYVNISTFIMSLPSGYVSIATTSGNMTSTPSPIVATTKRISASTIISSTTSDADGGAGFSGAVTTDVSSRAAKNITVDGISSIVATALAMALCLSLSLLF